LFGDNSQEAIISTPDGTVDYNSSQRLVINPGQGYAGGEGGDIYLWAGRGGDSSGSGGDIKIRGGTGGANTGGGTGGAGGYIRMEAGDGAVGDGVAGTAGYIEITGGYGLVTGGDVTITGGDGGTTNGKVRISTIDHNWDFAADGTTTLPGNLKFNGGPAIRVRTAPSASTGSAGDQAGDIAFDGTALYYCIADHGATYSATLTPGYTGVYPTVIQGSYPKPLTGWQFVFNTVTYTLIADATESNPGEWSLNVDQTISTDSSTIDFILPVNIWVKQVWGTTGTW
jgi:hypothetical protein